MSEIQDYIQLLIILLLSTFAVRAILTRNHKFHRPPGPPALPIIGHLHLISRLPHQSFHSLSSRYGPIMQLFLGSVPCIVASTPEAAKEFLKTHDTSFSNRFISSAVHYLSYGSKGFLFAPYGQSWKIMKKLCMSELLGGRTLDQFLPLRRRETLRFLKLLRNKGEAGMAVDVGAELMTLTNSIITRMIMGRTCCENDRDVEDIRKMVMDTVEVVGGFNVSDCVWFCRYLGLGRMDKRVKEIHDRFDTIMERVMWEHDAERKRMSKTGEGAQTRDLLDILLKIHHEDESTEVKVTRENIKAFILDLFMAGTDTTAITMEWALAELINHPQVMEKARQEIDSVTGNSRLIEESDLPNLPYLRAIVKETLRIHPAAATFFRESTESCNVHGYEIPAKSLLFVNLWSMARDPNLWEDPLEFRPERFMREENQIDVRGQNFKLIPFGSGRRACPGISLALVVVPTNLGAMIQCFEWKVNGTVSMEEKPSITLPRAHPLICVPMPRFSG